MIRDEIDRAYDEGLDDGVSIATATAAADRLCDLMDNETLVRDLANVEIDNWRRRHRSVATALAASAAINVALLIFIFLKQI